MGHGVMAFSAASTPLLESWGVRCEWRVGSLGPAYQMTGLCCVPPRRHGQQVTASRRRVLPRTSLTHTQCIPLALLLIHLPAASSLSSRRTSPRRGSTRLTGPVSPSSPSSASTQWPLRVEATSAERGGGGPRPRHAAGHPGLAVHRPTVMCVVLCLMVPRAAIDAKATCLCSRLRARGAAVGQAHRGAGRTHG